jgi:hypothetical protein
VTLIAALIRDHLVRVVPHLCAIDEIEVDDDALTRFVARCAVHMHGAHIQALEKRVLVAALGLRDAARDGGEYTVADIRPDGRCVVLLDAALHQKEDHLGALQEDFELEARIAGTDLVGGRANPQRSCIIERRPAAAPRDRPPERGPEHSQRCRDGGRLHRLRRRHRAHG